MTDTAERALVKRPADGFCDKIIRELAVGKRRKTPPVPLLIAHLAKRRRLGYDHRSGLFFGLLSNGDNQFLPGMMPEVTAVETGEAQPA